MYIPQVIREETLYVENRLALPKIDASDSYDNDQKERVPSSQTKRRQTFGNVISSHKRGSKNNGHSLPRLFHHRTTRQPLEVSDSRDFKFPRIRTLSHSTLGEPSIQEEPDSNITLNVGASSAFHEVMLQVDDLMLR